MNAFAAHHENDYLSVRVFQNNWVYVFEEHPDGDLATSLRQLAHQCIDSLNNVSCKVIIIHNLRFNDHSVECCCTQVTVSVTKQGSLSERDS